MMALFHDATVLTTPEITEAVTAAVHLVTGRNCSTKSTSAASPTGALPRAW